MDLKRLPPSLLVALGLAACGPSVDDGSTAGDSGDSQGSTVGPCLSPVVSTGDTTGGGSVGPCLGMVTTGPLLDVGATVGPCLVPPLSTSTGPDTDTNTDTDTDTDTDADTDTSGEDGTDSGSTGDDTGVGPCLVPPSAPGDPVGDAGVGLGSRTPRARSAILDQLLQAGVLPDDVAARLTIATDDDI